MSRNIFMQGLPGERGEPGPLGEAGPMVRSSSQSTVTWLQHALNQLN